MLLLLREGISLFLEGIGLGLSLALLWAKFPAREEFCWDNCQSFISLFLRMLEISASSIPVILKVKFKLLVYFNSSSFV